MSELASTQNETLSAKLLTGAASLASDAESAATAASEVLDLCPGQPQALLLLVTSLKLMGAEEVAREILTLMAEEYPGLAAVHYELGLLLGQLGKPDEAIERLSRAVTLERNHQSAWRVLGHQLALRGDTVGANKAYAQHSRLSLDELRLIEDAEADEEDFRAENMLRQALDISPTDVFARRALGELELRGGRLKEAEINLKRALDIAPVCSRSRYTHCIALSHLMDWKGAYKELQILLQEYPGDMHLESSMLGNLGMQGHREEAMHLFEKLRPEEANDCVVWINYALGARTLGLKSEIIVDAFHKCIALDPAYGSAWWGLADLKTYRFPPEEIAQMRAQLERPGLPGGFRFHLEFALGTALEQSGEYADSFEHFRKGNELRRSHINYNADSMHRDVMKLKTYFGAEFFEAHTGSGSDAPDPIFIVGMPRAGSTLIEQILASHSQVEGTAELPDIGDMAQDLMRKYPKKPFPDLLDDLDRAALRDLGEEYIRRTRSQRKLGRAFFTDKAGSNFLYLGLIQAILPNAKIIDARRHPLACGFSCYKQAFAPGALQFSYDQTDAGRYYRDYVEAMDLFDKRLPGRIHRVIHEELLQNPETEIRRMLAYCGLPFEEQCLRFYETDRSVRTSSSEQVRQPIRKKKVEAWQHYEPWLQPMKDVLGTVLTQYPDVPDFS